MSAPEFGQGEIFLLRATLAKSRARGDSTYQAVDEFYKGNGGRFTKIKIWSIVKGNDLGWRKRRAGADPNTITLDEAILIFREKELVASVERGRVFAARRAERKRRLAHCRKLNDEGRIC